jgi:hypothetical protein
MAAHKGPASLRPRCTQGDSSVAAIPVYQSTYNKCILCHINRWRQTKRPLEPAVVFCKKTTYSLWKSTSDVGCAQWVIVWIWYSVGRLQGNWLTTISTCTSATETACIWPSASWETQNKSSSNRRDRVVHAWGWQSFTACTCRTSRPTRYVISAVIPLYKSAGVNSVLMVWRALNILCHYKCHSNQGVCSLWVINWYHKIFDSIVELYQLMLLWLSLTIDICNKLCACACACVNVFECVSMSGITHWEIK